MIRVGVGSPRQTQIPPLELPRYGAERLCGIRCIATKLKPEPPKESSLTAMVLQRLDALVILTLTGSGFSADGAGGATGYVKQAYIAHLLPQPEIDREEQPYWSISPVTSLDVLTKQDFLDLVEGLEAEFQREYISQQVDANQDRVIAVGLMTDNLSEQQFEDGLAGIRAAGGYCRG